MKRRADRVFQSELRDAALLRRRLREHQRARLAARSRPASDGPGHSPTSPPVLTGRAAPAWLPSLAVPVPVPARGPARPASGKPVPRPAEEASGRPAVAAAGPPDPLSSGGGPARTAEQKEPERQTSSEGDAANSGVSAELVTVEFEPTDQSDDMDSDSSSSSEPCWDPLPEPPPPPPDDAGELADSEASDAEPARRAWFCRRPDCRRLNARSLPRCGRCGAPRLPPGSVDAAGPSAAPPPAVAPRPSPPAAGAGCLVCGRRPAAAALLHGFSCCRAACGRCARRLWKRARPCPRCDRQIERIVTVLCG